MRLGWITSTGGKIIRCVAGKGHAVSLKEGIMNDKANAAAPALATPSELESEFRDGIPSTVETPAETVEDYLKRIYPEYYVQIITNINAERGPEMTAHLLASNARYGNELTSAFIWSRSPEGDAFWRAVAQREII